MLAVNFHGSEPSTHFLSYDGNGNVIALTDAATAETTAVFEYGPFGELLRATGPMADQMPLRFSTMYADDVTGDVKYLYRDLSTPEGRWTSRDPIGDEAFIRHVAAGKQTGYSDWLRGRALMPTKLFSANNPLDFADVLGLLTLQEVADLSVMNRPAGTKDQITPFVMICLLWKESSFDATARNTKSSASGIAQILNGTADDIQDRLGPRWGGKDPFYALASGQRLRDHRDDPNVSTFAAYIYLDDRLNATGSLQGALQAYGPNADAVIKCADCLNRNCGIRFNQDTGKIEITNASKAQTCLYIIHR